MQKETTSRNDVHLMPWLIEHKEGDGLARNCILVATMDGNEIMALSLHVAEEKPGHH